jgi:GntR family transcriptional regulator, transcriptional repressor for pyruvate dehydrogenase complex
MGSETGDEELFHQPQPRSGGMDVGTVATAASGGDRGRTEKTSVRVAAEIVRDILAAGMRTGDRLPLEAAMVAQYHISRASLREALRLLEVQGLIRLKPGPGGGPAVGSVDPANLARTAALYFRLGAAVYADLLGAQALVEPLCAQLACDHPDRAAVLAPFLTVPPTPLDDGRYREMTLAFHRAVYELAANPVLTLLTGAVTHIVTDQVVPTMEPVELRPSILQEHATLSQAIVAGHHTQARRLMTEHFQAQHRYYEAHWPARLRDVIEWR